MTNVHGHAIMVLRYMLEKSLIAPNGISSRELQVAVGLNDGDFDSAENFLLQGNFVGGGWSELDDIKWITAPGIQYISEEMKHRTPISLNAEKVMRYLVQETTDFGTSDLQKVIEEINISQSEYMQAYTELLDFGFVGPCISGEYPLPPPTPEGRRAVRRNFQEFVSIPSIQTGAIFTGPVTGSNIQTIASAINSEIQQNVSSLAPEEIQEKIQQTLKELLGQVEEHLSLQQKAAYTQLAAEFQKETTQPQPDAGKLKKLLSGLGLLADLSGTIDLGQKAFQLIAIASPYILILDQIVVRLLKN